MRVVDGLRNLVDDFGFVRAVVHPLPQFVRVLFQLAVAGAAVSVAQAVRHGRRAARDTSPIDAAATWDRSTGAVNPEKSQPAPQTGKSGPARFLE
jgi:hypothetical protein